MLDVLDASERLTFAELCDRLPRDARGRKMTTTTLVSYATRGRRGVFLEAARVRGTWYTTEAAANAFFAARPARPAPTPPAPKPPSKAEAKYSARLKARLAAIGL